jgi:hypothetical protein
MAVIELIKGMMPQKKKDKSENIPSAGVFMPTTTKRNEHEENRNIARCQMA